MTYSVILDIVWQLAASWVLDQQMVYDKKTKERKTLDMTNFHSLYTMHLEVNIRQCSGLPWVPNSSCHMISQLLSDDMVMISIDLQTVLVCLYYILPKLYQIQ